MKQLYFSYIYSDKITHSKILTMDINSYSYNKLLSVLNNQDEYSINVTIIN